VWGLDLLHHSALEVLMALTPGGFGQIFVDMDTVSSMLSRLLSNLDEFPDPAAVATTSGPTHDVAITYSTALGRAADRASAATSESRKLLLEMDSTIREVVTALTAHDAGAVAEAKQLENFLNDAAADVAAETATTAQSGGAGANSTAGR